jgi:hypothetical protein
MALSKCPHCKKNLFEIVEQVPSGSRFKMYFVQCSSCGAPIASVDYFPVGQLVTDQEDSIRKLSHKLDDVETKLNAIINALNSRR